MGPGHECIALGDEAANVIYASAERGWDGKTRTRRMSGDNSNVQSLLGEVNIDPPQFYCTPEWVVVRGKSRRS